MKTNLLLCIVSIATLSLLVGPGCSDNRRSKTPPKAAVIPSHMELGADSKKKLVATWRHADSAATIQFWSNGLLVLNSDFFSKEKTEHFFVWQLDGDQTQLSVTFSDPRLNFSSIAAEREGFATGTYVHAIDKKKKTIVYLVKNRRKIFFTGRPFEGDPLPK